MLSNDPKNYWFWKKKFYKKIGIDFLKGRIILDAGCGNGDDAWYVSNIAKKVYGFDVEKFKEWKLYNSRVMFRVADAQNMPYKNKFFDGLYIKDVLHHVQDPEKVLFEIDRVTKKGAHILIIEGNRYNPLFYIHMTKMRGHEHFSQKKFKHLISKRFHQVSFRQFESHYIPCPSHTLFRVLTSCLEKTFEVTPLLNKFQSYNIAVIEK